MASRILILIKKNSLWFCSKSQPPPVPPHPRCNSNGLQERALHRIQDFDTCQSLLFLLYFCIDQSMGLSPQIGARTMGATHLIYHMHQQCSFHWALTHSPWSESKSWSLCRCTYMASPVVIIQFNCVTHCSQLHLLGFRTGSCVLGTTIEGLFNATMVMHIDLNGLFYISNNVKVDYQFLSLQHRNNGRHIATCFLSMSNWMKHLDPLLRLRISIISTGR